MRNVNNSSFASGKFCGLEVISFGIAIKDKLLSASVTCPSSMVSRGVDVAIMVLFPRSSFFHFSGKSSGCSFQHFPLS
ncbi:hypothetical protein Syun_025842 [Stephania yunnanensis]|uniref:Uncharacterized protein n=1 Tax=Stephania yunnanensis TaxID=152371 RepID=A0AAP0EVB9_9MAGN